VILSSKEFRLKLYENMFLIRQFENGAMDLYAKNIIRGSMHVYIGQEAIAAGICDNLDKNFGDCITTNHRGHGHLLAMGADPNRMMAELLGKEAGICRGRSGSMHITDIKKGIYGANGIVGAGIPIATGLAFSSAYNNKDSVAVTFFGDGAANEGVLYETLNLAGAWSLPVIFICENNRYAQTTPAKHTTSGKDIRSRAASFGIDSLKIDGNDIEEIHSRAKKVIESVRKEKKPFFIEAETYRFKGHWQGDPEVYRSKEEVKEWIEKKCPIKRYRAKLIEKYKVPSIEIDDIEKKVDEIIKNAKDFAIEAKEPEAETLFDNIYATG